MSDREMEPISGEPVETDGVYVNEWGREEELKRGTAFPPDPQLGSTTWKLSRLADEEQLNRQEEDESGSDRPRLHGDRGDK